MAGQATQDGAAYLANTIGGKAVPYIGTTAPSTWIPGQYWINGTTINCYDPQTSSWVTGPYDLYMSLLVGDPTTSGPGGGYIESISDASSIEDQTPGYLRQPVTFGVSTIAEPSVITNTNLLTFGPYTANQSASVQYTALMAIPAADSASYTPLASTVLNGLLLYVWQVPNPVQVLATQSIQVAAGTFTLGVS